MNKLKCVIITLLVGLGIVKGASAAPSEALTITVTPNAFYAVDIDTANVVLNLGTVDLGQSTQTVRPATVTIQSTFAQTDIRIQGSIVSSGQSWSFDSDTTSQETDSIAVWSVFTDVARSSAPPQSADYFSGTVPGAVGSDAVDSSNRYIGSSTGQSTTDLFENNSDFDSINMDGLSPDPDPSGKSHVWFYFRLPNATTDSDPQNITFTLTAGAPD